MQTTRMTQITFETGREAEVGSISGGFHLTS